MKRKIPQSDLPNDFDFLEDVSPDGQTKLRKRHKPHSKQITALGLYRQKLPRSGSVYWGDQDAPLATIGLRGLSGHEIRLDYNWNKKPVEQSIAVEWTPCRYGGERPWFRCRITSNGRYCGRRVGKFYGEGKYVACRHCYGLCYESQLEDWSDRQLMRAQKLWRRLGGMASQSTVRHRSARECIGRPITAFAPKPTMPMAGLVQNHGAVRKAGCFFR